VDTSEQDFWDIAVFYTGDWNSIKLSAAAAYTWIETAAGFSGGAECFDEVNFGEGAFFCNPAGSVDLWQIGASIMHKPSGLGVYAMYQHEDSPGSVTNLNNNGPTGGFGSAISAPDTDVWYVKPFWRKAWSPIGATVLYGEYGQYNDMYSGLVGVDMENILPACAFPNTFDCFVVGSEVERWGLGLVQEIDSAAMHLWVRWQHQELDVDLQGFGGNVCGVGNSCKVKQSFDDWDLFQAGGVIFF
jgi:hypothetical protein